MVVCDAGIGSFCWGGAGGAMVIVVGGELRLLKELCGVVLKPVRCGGCAAAEI